MHTKSIVEKNNLYPVFLKLETMDTLLVGGGNVALEKLHSLLGNSPDARVTIVAPEIKEELRRFITGFANCTLIEREFEETDLENKDLIVIAVNDKEISKVVKELANARGLLVNVADTPELCDFYLGSIVQKGNLKIAISTNGKSPTIAKRVKEVINDMIPYEMEGVLDNMQTIRNGINGDFEEKVKQLNDLTKMLVAKQITLADINKPEQKKWQRIVKWCLFGFIFMIIGHTILSYIPFGDVISSFKTIPDFINVKAFSLMLLCGFLAQMVDGSLGMGYGTISTTFLLAYGVNPAIVSSRVHSARVFSSGVSGYSHHRFGNINKKLFKTLVIPGIIGSIIGATLAYFGKEYASYVKLPLSIYTFYLGYFIISKAFKKKRHNEKVKKAGWLASVGGFMDAFAGGGWGTLVTSTLMSKRRSPRYVIGSVCLAEFFVVLASAITFFILLRELPLLEVAGLIIGGLIAAPIAARLVGKLPIKTMFIIVGAFVILASTNTFWKAIMQLMH
ncbi:MAG: TSUP family transporter [Sphingobacteriales bacterium]